jgi:hypothetical protein
MATIHQIEANRLNAKKSTGPRSVIGKAASSMNALKSGVDAKAEIILWEAREELEALTREYLDRFQPVTPEERFYVDILIRDDWQLRRLAAIETQLWGKELQAPSLPDEDYPHGRAYASGSAHFERLQRNINARERSYKSALHELERLVASRDTQPAAEPAPVPAPQLIETKPPVSQIGFVPPSPPRTVPTPQATLHSTSPIPIRRASPPAVSVRRS